RGRGGAADEAEGGAGDAGPGRSANPAATGAAPGAVPVPGPAPESASGALPGRAAGRGDAGFEPYDFLPTDPWHGKHEQVDPWHGKDLREARWASLKRGSGGLMADFPADLAADRPADRPTAEPDGPGTTP
ncbi:hypothetical protein G3I54_23170, partial [Streptomyces sp. SID14515]|nr:hypothetical protein [Streptomyces sp. SID14515]